LIEAFPQQKLRLATPPPRSAQRWIESLLIAWDAILSNRLRTMLTIIGVVIGVAVVALVASLLEGAQTFIADQAAGLGPGIARVEKASFQDFAGDGQDFEVAKAKRPDIDINEMKSLRTRIGDKLEIGAQAGGALPIRAGNLSMNGIAIQGVTSNYPLLSTLKLERGRNITETDDQYRREVCVLGADVADYLFEFDDPIGKTIKLGAFQYEIIGVYASLGSSLGASQDAFVQVPLNSFGKLFGARSRSLSLLAKAKADTQLPPLPDDELEDLLRFGMRQVRQLQPGADDSFSITTAQKIQAFAGTITGIAAAVLFPLTGIALTVAGIVVMNMMLASVTERTREIGIRMAIGARRRDILAQFLLESTMLTVIGGCIGLLIAAGLVLAVAKLSGLPVNLPAWAAVAALFVSVTVGVTFGVFPARRAARLDPIEALRSE
jgi:putative ABC transport system permease protein